MAREGYKVAKLGRDPSKVKVAPVGGTSARPAAIVAGKVDATAVLRYQVDSALAQAPALHVAQDLYSQLSDKIAGGAVDVVSADTFKNKAAALNAYMIAFTRGQRFVYEHPKETAQIVIKRYPDQNPADVEAAFTLYSKTKLILINPGGHEDHRGRDGEDALRLPADLVGDGIQLRGHTFVNNALQKLGRANYK